MIIDNVLVSVGMGRYQLISCVMFGLIIMYSNMTSVMYIFTAGDLKYRCEVPECDAPNPDQRTYEPDWLAFTTPYKKESGRPLKCERYAALAGPANGTRCEPGRFDGNKTERCRGSWVFEDAENTISTEFGIMCEENKWKLSSVGSVHNLGQFIGIPISGIVSDKLGRKFTMVAGTVIAVIINIIQSFSINYPMFLALEICASTIFSGVYAATFILAMELVLPKQRVLYFSILECFYPVGGMIVGFIASQAKDWRLLLRIVNIPALLFLSYYWLLEESLRWLEMQGKHEKVVEVLNRMAEVNNKSLPDLSSNSKIDNKKKEEENITKIDTSILKNIFRSSTIFWRMIRCSCVWIGVTLVYYGLNISATDIAGNKYLNFMLVSLVEIPACLLNWIIAEKMSRKNASSSMFMLSGITCILYNLTPESFGMVTKLSLFMISKLAIAVAFDIVYIQTAEIFPTSMRATMLSLCSMFGRIGSIMAPQVTLVAEYFGVYVAMFLMGLMGFVAAAITMTLPESKDVKLPDTVDEAAQIGNIEGTMTN